jgi:hypothetical protein
MAGDLHSLSLRGATDLGFNLPEIGKQFVRKSGRPDLRATKQSPAKDDSIAEIASLRSQ